MFLAKLVFVTLITGSGGYYFSILLQCLYMSHDLSEVEFIASVNFNKALQIQFNSTLGKFVGFTKIGVEHAQFFNNNSQMFLDLKYAYAMCKYYGEIGYPAIVDKLVQPKIKLKPVNLAGSDYPAALVCSAYDFYPEQIKVYWLRDGKVIDTDGVSTEELANGDWYYQIHSYLEYTPKSGEKISCVVEHGSVTKPMITDWEPCISDSDRNKIIIGACCLVLGVTIAASGIIYYKNKSTGRFPLPYQLCLMQPSVD